MANYYGSDDPTVPASPPRQRKQDKLVLGSFKDQTEQPARRRPYQYPPAQQKKDEQAAVSYPERQQWSPNQQIPGEHYPHKQPLAAGQQIPPPISTPVANPKSNYPYPQPGQMAEYGLQPQKAPRRKRRVGCLPILLVVLVLIASFAFFTGQRVLAFGSNISTQSPLSTQTGYMSTSERVNVLVMGYGGGTHDGANLTDSMMVISLLPQSKHTSLVSVPRDLWVQNPPNSGNYTKINAVYALGSQNGSRPADGGAAAIQKVSLVTGMDVKYWLTINFTGFRDLIDSIGGIDVYVPDAFTANYPKNDDPAIDASWIQVHFAKGNMHMNGEKAIEYARAREVIDNLAEGTDFARSARQQIIIKAALAKARDITAWPHLFNAMDALQHTIYTNMSFADLSEFALNMDLNDPHTAHIGLSNQNVLQDSQSSDGQYILIPQNNNWQALIDYVKQHLYN